MRHSVEESSDNSEKLFVKVFTADNSAKSLLADDRMSVSVICRQLAEKNHIVMDPKCSIVEHLPELYLERFYEDNESLVENVLLWTRDSSNRLYFMEKEEKYDLFVNPERYLLGSHSSERDHHLDDEGKSNLIDEFFTGGHPVPEVEGFLYLKSDGKKAWKKHFFVLRASGLYYSLKGKSKSSKDLVCLITFEMNSVYFGFGWRKKYKAPNDFGFAIKHPQIQAKNSKYIKYLCAESEFDLRMWTTGIRIAKYGRQLKDNYDSITRDIVEADLDSLADRRSFSVCSMSKTAQGSPNSPVNSCASVTDSLPASEGYPASEGCSTSESSGASDKQWPVRPTSITITSNYGNNWHQMSRHDSIRSSSTSSSSGFLSERDSTVSTPTKGELAFEADFPVGTIKRKPSAIQPKIPLTNTTRNLCLQSDDALVEMDSSDSNDEESGGGTQQHYGTLKRGTLRRSATDERLNNHRIYETFTRDHRFQTLHSPTIKTHVCCEENVVDELPLPPPPLVLQTSLSTLSLNSLPPPPSEVLDSPDFNSNSTTPTCMSPVLSPKKSPVVPPKPKLFRNVCENNGNNPMNKGMDIYSLPPIDLSSRSPMKGPLPPPPEAFLEEIQRVMEKKWKVAQTLSTDLSATPNQILGFRDPAYLPPNSGQNYSPMSYSPAVTPTNNNNYGFAPNIYDVLPLRPIMRAPEQHNHVNHNERRVNFEQNTNEIPVLKPNIRRAPPPLPKRSESTRLSQRQVQVRQKVMVWM